MLRGWGEKVEEFGAGWRTAEGRKVKEGVSPYQFLRDKYGEGAKDVHLVLSSTACAEGFDLPGTVFGFFK